MKTILTLISFNLAASILVDANAGTTAHNDNNSLALAADEVVVKPTASKAGSSALAAAATPVAVKPTPVSPPSPPLVVTATPAVTPAPAQVVTKSPTYRQLDELRTQNAILAEIVKAKEMQAKLNGQTGSTPFTSAVAGIAGMQSGLVSGQSATDTPATAEVQMVSGWEGDLIADVVLPTGGKISVRVGQSIPGVGVVKSIKRREVVVSGKSQNTTLPFANDTANGMR